MSRFSKIKVDPSHDGQVLWLTLDAPKGNVLDGEMMTELTEALSEEARAPGVKAIVFRGSGDHFSFGASVAEHRRPLVAGMLTVFHGLMRTVLETARPTAAAVSGQCLGGGLELAAACHWIHATPKAKFAQPEIKLGVLAPAASLILPHRVGQAAADDLLLTGRSVGAEEAREMGLVQRVADDPEQTIGEFLEREILPHSAVALHFATRAARQSMTRDFLGGIETMESLYLEELMATHDANEGIEAFIERRPPVWENR